MINLQDHIHDGRRRAWEEEVDNTMMRNQAEMIGPHRRLGPSSQPLAISRTTSNRLAWSSITVVDSHFESWQHAGRSRDNALSNYALRSAPLPVWRVRPALVVTRRSAEPMQPPSPPRSFNSASPCTRHTPTSSVPVNVCDIYPLGARGVGSS